MQTRKRQASVQENTETDNRRSEAAHKHTPIYFIQFFKWANPSLFFVFLRSFQTNITIFTTNICEKCPSSIRCRDSNPQPSERESLPITNRPGLVIVKPGTIKVKKSYFARQKFGIILNPILKVKFIAAVVVQPSLEQHQSADLLRRSSVKNCFSCGLPLRQQRFPRATFADFFKQILLQLSCA